MSEYYISIDQGTTSTRAILYSPQGILLAQASVSIESSFPENGWVEQSPEAIIQSVETVLKQVLESANKPAHAVRGIGISNQRETTFVWDKTTGKAVYPAIIWQDKRTADLCAQLKQSDIEAELQEKTGLLLDPYFSATKLAWILDNVPNARAMAKANKLAFGTVDCFLLWHLTDGKMHATDITNASRTLLFNIRTKAWDSELLNFFNIPENMLPKVHDCCYAFGNLSKRILGVELPIVSMVGDQQSASIGQGCIAENQAKSTYGTGCFMLLNTGETCVYSKNKLLTTIAYQVSGKTTYALEGSVFVAGSLIKWLKNSLKFFKTESQIDDLIASTNDHNDIIFIPAFCGLGAPFWDPYARGAMFGLTQDTSIGHIIKAALEGICFQTKDLIESLNRDTGNQLQNIKVDGGMVANDWFLQSMANILNIDILKAHNQEATAFGAFLLAGVSTGLFSSLSEAAKLPTIENTFSPNISDCDQARQKYQRWLAQIEKIKVRI